VVCVFDEKACSCVRFVLDVAVFETSVLDVAVLDVAVFDSC